MAEDIVGKALELLSKAGIPLWQILVLALLVAIVLVIMPKLPKAPAAPTPRDAGEKPPDVPDAQWDDNVTSQPPPEEWPQG